jgi:glutamate formiminotransferase
MNLVDFEVTGVRAAFDAVTHAASARDMEVVDSEIVGLAPAAALTAGTVEHVRLTGFSPDAQILEQLVDAG